MAKPLKAHLQARLDMIAECRDRMAKHFRSRNRRKMQRDLHEMARILAGQRDGGKDD